jgi:nucleoside-diphosphate-sugar epimerase
LPFSLASADDLGEFTRRLLHSANSPHPVYNLGGPAYSHKDIAAMVKEFIPEARISFGSQPVASPGQQGMPSKLSMARAKADFDFTLLPQEEAVKIQINDARLEAGLPPLKL